MELMGLIDELTNLKTVQLRKRGLMKVNVMKGFYGFCRGWIRECWKGCVVVDVDDEEMLLMVLMGY